VVDWILGVASVLVFAWILSAGIKETLSSKGKARIGNAIGLAVVLAILAYAISFSASDSGSQTGQQTPAAQQR
jgi:hypothetical protein